MISSRYADRPEVFGGLTSRGHKPLADKPLRRGESAPAMRLAPALLLAWVPPQSESPREIHGAWIASSETQVFSSRAQVGKAMEFLANAGANVVCVPAWADGVPRFQSNVLKESLAVDLPERDLLEEATFEAHRVGLEILAWFEPGIACAPGGECPVAKKRPEYFAHDADGKLVVEKGLAKLDMAGEPARDLLRRVVLEVCGNIDVDGVVAGDPIASFEGEILAIDPHLVVATPAGAPRPGKGPALPVLDAPDPEKGGDRLLRLVRLKEKNGALEETLRNGAWAEPALLPWRGGKIWRKPAEPVDPAAGEGHWTWNQRQGEPSVLVLDGGQTGHATWTFTPRESGVYSLYAWIPARGDHTSKASYRISSNESAKNLEVDATQPRFQGWVRLGNVRLEGRKETEVARVVAGESEPGKVTVAGPLLPILNRRAMRQ